jgi:DNA-binding PucR family transcriptional regulator
VGRSETALAVGEPAAGVDGWRYSHRQAAAALPVARAGPRRHLRYANVALLTSALRDELLTATLRRRYIEPLADERGGGEVLLATLRAYFAAERNVSSAAAALGVSRPTVRSRLATIEQRIGDPPEACGAELEIALRLEQLRAVAPPRDAK